ncbi:MAG: hypothetical protein LIO90_01835 [Bacteroidales bacterium]|nr:hypothetical protein [Bacteroidales bacterium]
MKYNIKRNVTKDNDLWDADKSLFAKMDKEAISEREREFFDIQHYKQVNNYASANDLVMSENSNTDHIYIIRTNADEYIVGNELVPDKEIHTMNLNEALTTNLKVVGLLDRDLTLLDWLRERDYQGVEYEHNFDDI